MIQISPLFPSLSLNNISIQLFRKKINKLWVLACISLFVACTNEEPETLPIASQPNEPVVEKPAPANPVLAPYLTIIVDTNYNTNTIPSEDWILVHKENGDL